MAPTGLQAYLCTMESETEIRHRWRYLRDLLIDQLGRFESGMLQLRASDVDVSDGAIAKLKRNIQDFDELIARSVAREAPATGPDGEIAPPPG
jgi:hypothetical protein